jgi:Domain of unknown function (DUF4371)
LLKADAFSIALDESTDVSDTAQLSVFVRYFNGVSMIEELLGLIPLKGQTRGEDVTHALVKFFEDNNIDLTKVVAITTDGAPGMLSKNKGLAGRIRQMVPGVLSYHCIIHQTALCAKLSQELTHSMGI